jgi:hypothetical protein
VRRRFPETPAGAGHAAQRRSLASAADRVKRGRVGDPEPASGRVLTQVPRAASSLGATGRLIDPEGRLAGREGRPLLALGLPMVSKDRVWRLLQGCSVRVSPGSTGARRRKSRRHSSTSKTTCLPSTPFRAPLAPSCEAPTHSSASIARSGAAPTFSGIFDNDQALIRLAGLLIEQNEDWLVTRRYLSKESMAELPT